MIVFDVQTVAFLMHACGDKTYAVTFVHRDARSALLNPAANLRVAIEEFYSQQKRKYIYIKKCAKIITAWLQQL